MKQNRWIQMGLLFSCMVIMTLAAACGGGGGTPAPTPVRTISYSTTVFQESAANDGSISTSSTITLSNDTFTGANGDDWSSLVSNVPSGLTASLVRTSATTSVLSFTGTAKAHTSANNISNLTVTFSNAQFSNGQADQVSGAVIRTLSVNFHDPAPIPAPLIKGFWGGTQGTVSVSAIILANGDSWIVFQESGITNRFARLQTTQNNTSFSSSGMQYLLQSGTTEAAAATGGFTEKATLTGTMTAVSGSSSLNLAYNSRYELLASLNDAAGSWKGSYGSSGVTLTMTVTSAGVLTGISSTGCNYSGSLQPRSADPAVFDLGFSEVCLVGTAKVLSGIATVSADKTSLFLAATTADGAQGALFVGARQ